MYMNGTPLPCSPQSSSKQRMNELESEKRGMELARHQLDQQRELVQMEELRRQFRLMHGPAAFHLFDSSPSSSSFEAEASSPDVASRPIEASKRSEQRAMKWSSRSEDDFDRYWYDNIAPGKFGQLIPPRSAPLSQQDEQVLDWQVYSYGGEEDEIVERFNAPINKLCLRTLSPNTWVNDEIVNAYCQLCRHRSPNSLASTHLFSSFFLNTITAGGYKYEAVRKWTTPRQGPAVDLFAKRAALFPINLNSVHWIFAFVDFAFKEVVVLDSMHGENSRVYTTIFRYLQDEHKDKKQGQELPNAAAWRMVGGNQSMAPRQNNSDDCGVFSSMFCNLLAHFFALEVQQGSRRRVQTGKLLQYISAKDMPRIRQQIQLDILRGAVFPDPTPEPPSPPAPVDDDGEEDSDSDIEIL